jgi:Uma2 family endonuclease
VSWEEFHDWALSFEGRAEWVDGEIEELMGENHRNFLLIDFLIDLIKACVSTRRLGRVYYLNFLMKLVNRPTGRMPDIMFVANDHLDRARSTYLDGPADLVVEVVSPDSETRDRFIKLGEYQDAGIPEYWLIDAPRTEAIFYVLSEDGKYREATIGADGIYTSSILPELRLRVDWLWRDPHPTLNQALADLPE